MTSMHESPPRPPGTIRLEVDRTTPSGERWEAQFPYATYATGPRQIGTGASRGEAILSLLEKHPHLFPVEGPVPLPRDAVVGGTYRLRRGHKVPVTVWMIEPRTGGETVHFRWTVGDGKCKDGHLSRWRFERLVEQRLS